MASTGSFEGLLSLGEAAEIMNVDQSTLRYAILHGKLIEGKHVRKFGKQWVITRLALVEVFGYTDRGWLDKDFGKWVDPSIWAQRREWKPIEPQPEPPAPAPPAIPEYKPGKYAVYHKGGSMSCFENDSEVECYKYIDYHLTNAAKTGFKLNYDFEVRENPEYRDE